jgi:predicted nucleotidyltransferase
MATSQVTIPQEQIADFCIKHHIRKLSVFGSVLRDDFRPDSDVDVLVEFEPDYHATLLDLGGIQMELSDLLGRFVDLKTSGFIHESILPMVIASMQVEYERN